MIKVSVLTIGDEILIGQIVNRNAAKISEMVTALGASIAAHSVVGDDKLQIHSEIDRLSGFSDFILLTGGLGPTHDDITKNALLDYFDDEYIFHENEFLRIKELFESRGRQITERNRLQAMLPSKCTALGNPAGTAPGMLFKKGGVKIISMPGVPVEMQGIMQESVLPLISKEIENDTSGGIVKYRTLRTAGVPESTLADKIGDISDLPEGAALAFLPSYYGVKLRIGARANNFTEAENILAILEKRIINSAGKYIYGTDDTSLEEATGNLLREKGKNLSVAESCTGGLLGAKITAIPGSSDYFAGGVISYSNEIKIRELGVNPEIIEKFGAVSKETCEEMAVGIIMKYKTDYGISITGVAGPCGGTPDKPVGTVWIGLAGASVVKAYQYNFGRNREQNRERSAYMALTLLYRELTGF
jgi:nicotinamide-nucleotide amidase